MCSRHSGLFDKFVNTGRSNAFVVDVGCSWAGKNLGNAVEDTGVLACHFLLAWNEWPSCGGEKEEPAFNAEIEKTARRLSQRREAFVFESYDACARHAGAAGDFALPVGNTRTDQYGPVCGSGKHVGALLLEFRSAYSGRCFWKYAPLRIAGVCEEAARTLHLHKRWRA